MSVQWKPIPGDFQGIYNNCELPKPKLQSRLATAPEGRSMSVDLLNAAVTQACGTYSQAHGDARL